MNRTEVKELADLLNEIFPPTVFAEGGPCHGVQVPEDLVGRPDIFLTHRMVSADGTRSRLERFLYYRHVVDGKVVFKPVKPKQDE